MASYYCKKEDNNQAGDSVVVQKVDPGFNLDLDLPLCGEDARPGKVKLLSYPNK